MTVARLRVEVSGSEFMSWAMYYSQIAQQKQLESMRGGR